MKPLPNQSYEKHDGTQFDITFERDLNLQVYTRSGYTILDLIANVGGLRTILSFVFSYLMSYWSFFSVQNYMVSTLFTYQRKGIESDSSKTGNHTKKINGNTYGLCEYLRSKLPSAHKKRNLN